MNILIPDSWLREFIKTDASPQTIAEKLSLCSLSVEKLHKKGADTVYEIEITPNRYDTLSVLGIAREVAAVLPCFGIKAELVLLDGAQKATPSEALAKEGTDLLKVTIANPELCSRFTAIVLDNIEIKLSPKIVQDRLEMSGIRALNNVVDVSNYLMLELGQPMHIFDFDKIEDGELILRESKKGEQLTTLDGIERTLPKDATVIESGGKLIDLCGIMGGQNSEVDKNTKRILLFIQIYDPIRIRKTSQELALRTEASARFEKGIDPAGILPAMSRAIEMLKENANARVCSSLTDIQNEVWQPHEIELEVPEVEKLLGVRIEKEEIVKILKPLGFKITIENSWLQIPTIVAKVPSWRDKDITIPADLIEEIARLYGYHNLPNLMPEGAIPTTPREKKFYWEDRAKDFLKHQGFYEVYNYSFISKELLLSSNLDPSKALKVRNPLNEHLEYMRPSLLPSLLQNLSENEHAWPLKLFELERVYLPKKDRELPQENFRLAGLVFNNLPSEALAKGGEQFYVVKGIIKGLLEELGIKNVSFEPLPHSSAKITSGSEEIGTLGHVKPTVVAFDLDFDKITELASDLKTYEPIPEYPPIIEDLSIILPPKTFIAEVIALIKKQSKLIRKIEVVDTYPEKGSVTLRITYQHLKKTLTDEEVSKIREKIIKVLHSSLRAKVRSK